MRQVEEPDIGRASLLRRAVHITAAVLTVAATLAGCSWFRSTPQPTATARMSGTEQPVRKTQVPTSVTPDVTPTSDIRSGVATPTERPAAMVPSVPSPTAGQAMLTIDVPEAGQSIYSPLYIRGSGIVPFERALEVQVLDTDGEVLGGGPILFGPGTSFGDQAVYEGTLPFHQPERQQLGSVRVLLRSPRDGSVAEYAQVLVVLAPAGSGPTRIRIDAPAADTVITNPVRVEGIALAPQNQITVRLKSGPAVLAADTVPLAGEIGQPGRFSVDLAYARLPASASRQPGYPAPAGDIEAYIEVFYRSPKDGRIAEIAAVPVIIPGEQ